MNEVFVVDTSSIIHVRRLMSQERRSKVQATYDVLVKFAQEGLLVFPQAVVDEIKQGSAQLVGTTDFPLDWANACHEKAVPNHDLYAEVREVLREVPDLLDKDKPSTTDEADPYVVAVALKLRSEDIRVTVVTEERNDTPDKTSMASACGILGLPAISMRVFLARQRIWHSP